MPDPIVVPGASPAPAPAGQPGVVAPRAEEAALDFEGLPERFKGKNVKDILTSVSEGEKRLNKALQETEQWKQFSARQVASQPQQGVTGPRSGIQGGLAGSPEEIMEALEPEQRRAVEYMVAATVAPIYAGISSIMKEFVKNQYEDFPELEEQATVYFRNMPPHVQADPTTGWDLAYRLAKADSLPRTKTKGTPAQPALGITAPVPAAPEYNEHQKKIMKALGMSEAEYTKYENPSDPTMGVNT